MRIARCRKIGASITRRDSTPRSLRRRRLLDLRERRVGSTDSVALDESPTVGRRPNRQGRKIAKRRLFVLIDVRRFHRRIRASYKDARRGGPSIPVDVRFVTGTASHFRLHGFHRPTPKTNWSVSGRPTTREETGDATGPRRPMKAPMAVPRRNAASAARQLFDWGAAGCNQIARWTYAANLPGSAAGDRIAIVSASTRRTRSSGIQVDHHRMTTECSIVNIRPLQEIWFDSRVQPSPRGAYARLGKK